MRTTGSRKAFWGNSWARALFGRGEREALGNNSSHEAGALLLFYHFA